MANQPWLDNPAWSTGKIRSNARSSVKGSWLFAVIWNALSAPLYWVIPEELAGGNQAAWVGVLFPLVGVCLAYVAVKTTFEWRRFGPTVLKLDPFPGAIGGHVGGEVIVDVGFHRDRSYELMLECVRRYRNNEDTREEVKWQSGGPAEASPYGRQTRLAFRFDVPKELPESEQEDTSYHFWRLRMQSDLPGVNLDRNFTIPVYATGENSRRIDADTSAVARESALEQFDLGGGKMPFKVERRGDWVRLFFPMGRDIGSTVGCLVVAAGFGGGVWFVMENAPDVLSWVFVIGLGFFAGVLSLIALFLPFNSLDVRLGEQEIRIQRRWLGLPFMRRWMHLDEVQDVSIKKGSSTTYMGKTTVRYRVMLVLRGDKEVGVAEGLTPLARAEALQSVIKGRLGV